MKFIVHVEYEGNIRGLFRSLKDYWKNRRHDAGWDVYAWEDLCEAHMLPRDDRVCHEAPGDSCICGPSAEIQTKDSSPDWTLFTHHSLDGREQNA